MKLKVFQYAIPAPAELSDLNQYLASHRVTSMTHEIVASANGATLVVVVETAASHQSAPTVSEKTTIRSSSASPRIDYKEVLSEPDFAVYSRLRELRKKRAEQDGIEVFNIFNNAQMASMVTERIVTEAKLLQIEGVGAGRVSKYADQFLGLLRESFPTEASEVELELV